jgi:thiamine kinase-like enzyme
MTETRLREAVAAHDHEPAELVPTHGDWQPRNWLVHEGRVSVIDLGRADLRPAATDLARLARQEWLGRPDLEEAFLAGYGGDPRETAAWQRTLLREAIGTAVWAHQVGDEPFEAQGHRMIAQALGRQ